MSDLTQLTLTETISGLEKKDFSTEELNGAYLTRIKKLNPKLNSYLFVNEESNKIPAAIKDIISVKGMPLTCGSKILEGYIPPYNATVIKKLMANSVSVLGKTNLDEFAMGSSGENSAYEKARNPWDVSKVPGGSSSGSAVAVAADLCAFALGTDTGGSIRQPASLCGVVGLKPSYGRVSRYGAQSMASSLDQIGPITKTVADARLVLNWIEGADGKDNNAVPNPKSQIPNPKSIKGTKIGVPIEYFAKGLDQDVEEVINTALNKLKDLGAETVEVSLPHTQYSVATYYLLMASEVSSNLARYDGIRFGKDRSKFGPEAKRRIILGTFALSAGYFEDYFIKAAKVRTLIKQDFEKAFQKCDVIAGPVSPTVAWNLGEKISDPLTMYLSDIYTLSASLAGIPGLSVPCGFSAGLPVGLQLLGEYMDEETILSVGEIYQSATDWHKQKPGLN
ncbi:MAG: Asp-tRNA(Asn)/Glu-tRNA(Gln) amidotransferase subunit GatA [Patescibacteria group bacterium]